jgi:hypothetical protein
MPEVKTAEQQYDPQEILNVNVGVLGERHPSTPFARGVFKGASKLL